MSDYKIRVKIEADELEVKLNALNGFMVTTQFSDLSFLDQELLSSQLNHMRGYLNVLHMRLSAFDLGS